MENRFGDAAQIVYYDISRPESLGDRSELAAEIRAQGLIYPVTVIDGEPLYEGAVSYPAILRAVQTKLNSAC